MLWLDISDNIDINPLDFIENRRGIMVLGKKSSPSKNENYFYMAILRAFFKLRVLAIFIIQSQNASVKQIKHCSLVFSTAQAAWSAASSRKAPSKLQIMPLVSASPSVHRQFSLSSIEAASIHKAAQLLANSHRNRPHRIL